MENKDLLKIIEDTRLKAESSMINFVRLIRPDLYLGDIHLEIIKEIECIIKKEQDGESLEEIQDELFYLLMLPRGHLKSVLMALAAAYAITLKPDITILYTSENESVTEGQLGMIKKAITSKIYKMYWGEMVSNQKSKRAKWTKTEITVDHPTRKNNLNVREPTVSGRTIGAADTGAHYDLGIFDDLVTEKNAYTEAGRKRVKDFYSGALARLSGGSKILLAGTTYHPRDLYADMEDRTYEDNDGTIKRQYKIRREVVEKDGVFIWPRKKAADGKYYGFDKKQLSIKKENTSNPIHFYSQYYMNPSALDGERIGYNNFRYYNADKITKVGGSYYIGDKELYIVAAMDFAFSLRDSADSTSIVVIGTDEDNNNYVLEVDRFKTLKIKDMYRRMISMYYKWGFKSIRCETVAAQEAVVEQLSDYAKEKNIKGLHIIKYKPNRHDGSKEERMAAQLDPIYQSYKMFHNKEMKYNSSMEEEIVSTNPKHDDIKNSLADALMDARPPMRRRRRISGENGTGRDNASRGNSNSKFGGHN